MPDYVALQAFVAREPRTRRALQEIRRLLRERRGVASTLGWGPAFLHSTGQLHKGGPDHGVFLQITADDTEDVEIPGTGYSFGRLARAQSLGDLAALEERGRRVPSGSPERSSEWRRGTARSGRSRHHLTGGRRCYPDLGGGAEPEADAVAAERADLHRVGVLVARYDLHRHAGYEPVTAP